MSQADVVPKVSVIMCFLNMEQFITEAVESVLQQTYDFWELILLDDGSTDGSTALAQQYAHQHAPKIVYCEHAGHLNRGLSASRNAALSNSRGEFIAFLDADDVWLPTMLAHNMAIMQQRDVAMICEATEYWNDWVDSSKKNIIIPVGGQQDHLYAPPQLVLELYPLGTGASPCVCAILVKKEALNSCGGFDESFPGMYEDQVLLVKIYLSEPVYVSSSCHNRYRQRPQSLLQTSLKSGTYMHDRLYFLQWCQLYFSTQHITDTRIIKRLEHALLPYKPNLIHFVKRMLPARVRRFIKSWRQ
ncbi:glycosyltransferase family 2 protein [Hymenobacter arizonensis]|uniref:Glycosyltransferase involved in cell wall bisynthesis n=1 Tax=Hymenobacter arizonensis TaxID=1227077 RepID=A0A1I6BRU6_HYMAR|nr:glycosyltransferase family A protein [Hymenobacter arizonensis]SFQ83645.1 Glycosyltransferase involved in cell wall bisynthesis [Hymenobacter arizonensis]